MARALLRQDGDTWPVDLDDLRDDVRAGRVPGSAELLYAPWSGDEWAPLRQLAQLAEELDAPDARLADSLSSFRLPWVSLLGTALVLGVAIAQFRGLLPAAVYDIERADRVAVGWEAILFGGAWWTPITSQFVHAGPLHVFGNLVAISVSGWRVERALGPTAWLVVAAASVLVGAVSVIALCPLPVVGSSTLGFGLLAAHVTIGFRYGDALPSGMRGKYGFGVLPVLLLILLPNLTLPAVAHSAHVGGLLGGGLAALLVAADTTAPVRQVRRRQLLNLATALGMVLAPALATPLLQRAPGLVAGWSVVVDVEESGLALRLPWRVARTEGTLLGAPAWSTSPGSPDVLFAGLQRSRETHDAERLARTWERGADLVEVAAPSPLDAGWTAIAFDRRPLPGDSFPAERIVEHQQLRGSTLVRLGYVVRLHGDAPGARARLFEAILRDADLGEPPSLERARQRFVAFPEIGENRQELGRQLYLIGAWTEAEQVLAPLVDPAAIRGSDALRVRLDLWARHPDAVRAAHPGEEPDTDWLVAVVQASVAQRFYQDRGIRALVAFGRCDEATAALGGFSQERPDAPEVAELALVVAGCADR